jgi:diguanylate cyclase (GGDEF)-like protein
LARLASFPELIPNPIIELDLTGAITYLNPAAYSKFAALQQLHTEHPLLVGLLELVQSQQQRSYTRAVRLESGEVYEEFIHYMAESDLVRVFLTDITERKRAEEELEKRDQLLQAVASASGCLLTEMDFTKAMNRALAILGQATGVDRVVIYENHSHPVTGAIAMSLRFAWVRPEIAPLLPQLKTENQSYRVFGVQRWYETLSRGQAIKGTADSLPMSEQAILHRDRIHSIVMVPIWLGPKCWGHIHFHDCRGPRQWSRHEESTLFTMAASLSGVLQRCQTDEMIRHQAQHDLLTELPNRSLFNQELDQVLAQAEQQPNSLAVMFLDLDRFKTINDTLGHSLGDQLLKEVAKRLNSILQPGQMIARWGGDEFTILLPQVQKQNQVQAKASSLLACLNPPFEIGGHELYVSASIGIAFYDRHSSDAETLIKNADTALYQAKDKGRNSYRIYTPAMSTKTPELLAIEKGLRSALGEDQLRVHYQPQVNLKTRKVVGMEALVRWQHPEMGSVSPGVFIPIAEESNLIIEIGNWVLRQACAQNKAWQNADLPPITISVNLSPKQFRQARLVESIALVLAETGLDAQYLDLEITESIAIEDIQYTQTIMRDLSSLGIRLSIDDFGTGHSSLSRLQLLPLHTLKIDQSFIKDMSRNPKALAIVSAIVSLGRSLGLSLVAEGVEHEEQLEFLQSIQCDAGQGYLFCRPQPAEKITAVLRGQKHKERVNNSSV